MELTKAIPSFLKTLGLWYKQLPIILEGVKKEMDLAFLLIQICSLKQLYLESFGYPNEVQMKSHQLFTELLDDMERKYPFRLAREKLDTGIDPASP